MLLNDKLTEPNLANESVGNETPAIEGRILYERYLVGRDLSDRTLGGGFSAYLVKDLKNFCSEVILKTAAPGIKEVTDGPSFQEVCGVMIQLGHRNVEQILETGTLFDGSTYAVARKSPGVRLAEVIGRENRLELPRIAAMVEQIADALAAAHSKNVLHCDVSPGNILLTFGEDGHESVRLINFGSAWPVDARGAALEKLLPGCESFSYAAPEMHAKLGHRSPASDVYSLGVIAYRLITGRLPFQGVDRVSLLESINAGQILPPTEGRTDLSSATEKLLLSALQFEPAWRPQNVEDFGTRLASSLRAGPRIQMGVIDAVPETPVPLEDPAEIAAPEPPAAQKVLLRIQNESKPGPPVSDRAAAWALMILLLAGALSIPIGQTLLAEERTGTVMSPTQAKTAVEFSSRTVKYWFAQPPQSQYRGTLPNQEAELFLSTDTPGHFFVFSEGVDAEGRINFKLIFPTAAAAGPVELDKPVGTTAAAPRDGEQLWIVWLPPDSAQLDEFRKAVDGQGLISENEARKLRHLLERNRSLNVTISQDALTGQTVLTGSGERMVHRVEPIQN